MHTPTRCPGVMEEEQELAVRLLGRDKGNQEVSNCCCQSGRRGAVDQGVGEPALAIDECRGKTDFGLLLVNPDEFDMVNRRLGRDSGDAALAQVASMLCDSLRRTDGIYRYQGAAIFSKVKQGHQIAAIVICSVSLVYFWL